MAHEMVQLLVLRKLIDTGTSTTARPIVDIVVDNTAATGAVPLRIQQDSTGDIIRIFDGPTQVVTVDDVGQFAILMGLWAIGRNVLGT